MEIFEIAKTEEEREKDYQKIVEHLRQHGIREDWKISSLIQEKDNEFGLNNNFPKLSEKDEERRTHLTKIRELAIGKYNSLSEKILPMLILEREMWNQISEINKELCELEGHRLSEKVETEYCDDGLSHSVGYYRTCLVCGKRVYKEGLKYNDVVVKGEEGPKRILNQMHLK